MNSKVGRPIDERRKALRELMWEMTDRTFARWYKAFATTDDFGKFIRQEEWSKQVLKDAAVEAGDRHGNLNVSKYVRICEHARILKVLELIESGHMEMTDDDELVFSQMAVNEWRGGSHE